MKEIILKKWWKKTRTECCAVISIHEKFDLKIAVAIATLFFLSPNNARSQHWTSYADTLSVSQWLQDFDYLKEKLNQIHPNQFYRVSQRNFEAVYQAEINKVQENTYSQNLISLKKVIASIQDGHTHIPMRNVFEIWVLPFRTYLFEDGLYVIESIDDTLIGAKIEKVNGVDIQKVLSMLSETVSADNEFHIRNMLPYRLMTSLFLEGYGLIDPKSEVTFTLHKNGEAANKTFQFMPAHNYFKWRGSLKPEINGPISRSVNVHSNSDTLAYWRRRVNNNIEYMQYNTILNRKDVSMASFSKRLSSDLNARDKLIIDLRECSGGNKGTYHPLFNALKGSSIDKNGQLILLIGRRTNSAASSFISKMVAETNAITVGEDIGGAVLFYSDVTQITLPNSKIIVEISTRFNLDSHFLDPRRTISPDFRIPVLASDYFDMKDTQLDFALAMKATRSELIKSLFPEEAIGRYEMESGKLITLENLKESGQIKTSALFELDMYKISNNIYRSVSNYDLTLELLLKEDMFKIRSNGATYTAKKLEDDEFTYTELLMSGRIEEGLKKLRKQVRSSPNKHVISESELNRIGYHLLRKGEYSKSIQVFKANVEIYPTSSNVYDSLGEAYYESGKLKPALSNYKIALGINPRSQTAKDAIHRILNEIRD